MTWNSWPFCRHLPNEAPTIVCYHIQPFTKIFKNLDSKLAPSMWGVWGKVVHYYSIVISLVLKTSQVPLIWRNAEKHWYGRESWGFRDINIWSNLVAAICELPASFLMTSFLLSFCSLIARLTWGLFLTPNTMYLSKLPARQVWPLQIQCSLVGT